MDFSPIDRRVREGTLKRLISRAWNSEQVERWDESHARWDFGNPNHDPHTGEFTSGDEASVSSEKLTKVGKAAIAKAAAAKAKGKSGKATDPVYHAYGAYWEAKQMHEANPDAPEYKKEMDEKKAAYQQIKKLGAMGKLGVEPLPKAPAATPIPPPPPAATESKFKIGDTVWVSNPVFPNTHGKKATIVGSAMGPNQMTYALMFDDPALAEGETVSESSLSKIPPLPPVANFSPPEVPSGAKATAVLPDEIPDMGFGGAMKKQKTLGGSFNASLYQDGAGNKYVLKQGLNDAHTVNENVANAGLQAAGVLTPGSSIVDVGGKKTLIAKFVPGQTLDQTPSIAKVQDQIKKNFVANAVFGNWDVFGMDDKNMMVDPAGNVAQIDNGGSMGFRARGAPKPAGAWTSDVKELETMKGSNAASNLQKKIYGSITLQEMAKQAEDLKAKKLDILKAMGNAGATSDQKNLIAQRIDDAYSKTHLPPPPPVIDYAKMGVDDLKKAFDKTPTQAIGDAIIKKAAPGSLSLADFKKYGGASGHLMALKAFTGNAYGMINTNPTQEASKKCLEAVSALQKFKQGPNQVLTRSLGWQTPVEREEFLEPFLDGGQKTLMRTMSSFSQSPNPGFGGGQYGVSLKLVKSKSGVDVDPISSAKGEKEVVFPRGTKLKLVGPMPDLSKPGKVDVQVEEA